MDNELIRGAYTKEMQENMVKRISKYAGTTMSSNGNPCITKREAIALADYIRYLEDEIMGYATNDN